MPPGTAGKGCADAANATRLHEQAATGQSERGATWHGQELAVRRTRLHPEARAERSRSEHRRRQADGRSPVETETLPDQSTGVAALAARGVGAIRSEEHTSELQSLMRISYADFCLQ